MCCMDIDLDDGGLGEEEKDDEFWFGDGVKILPPPVAHRGGSALGNPRGTFSCLACGLFLVLWNLSVILASVVLLVLVFAVVLLPTALLLYTGCLCHTRVLHARYKICSYFDDNSCAALIILGFGMSLPLFVLATSVFCSVLRKSRLPVLIQPIKHAQYKGRLIDWTGSVHAWV